MCNFCVLLMMLGPFPTNVFICYYTYVLVSLTCAHFTSKMRELRSMKFGAVKMYKSIKLKNILLLFELEIVKLNTNNITHTNIRLKLTYYYKYFV